MDVTNVFKACVKTAKTRNKALGVSAGDNDKLNKHSILGHSKRKQDFGCKAKDIVLNISKLQHHILKHRKDYINAEHLLDASNMLDKERDDIDAEVQVVMKTCSQVLRDFKQEVLKQPCTLQQKEHRQGVLSLIEDYLKAVCQIYSEQRAIRVKRAVDKQKMLRLEPDSKKLKIDDSVLPQATPITTPTNELYGNHSSLQNEDWFAMDDDSPTAEEIQMFEEENQRLFNDLSTLADEVRQIEGQVMEISKLQDIFTSKILQQDHEMDRIADTVVNTTENIKTANEDIREAMKKNASFRVWMLFFLIVMAFSLLFLDWYND